MQRFCFIQCESLPKGADVELQLISLKDKTDELAELKQSKIGMYPHGGVYITSILEISLGIGTSVQCTSFCIPEALLIVRAALRVEGSSTANKDISEDILVKLVQQLQNISSSSGFSWKLTLFMRIYYISSATYIPIVTQGNINVVHSNTPM